MAKRSEYVYANGQYPNGNPDISSNNAELFFGGGLSYHFQMVGPVDLAILLGAMGWSGVGHTSKVDLPISAGVAAQGGANHSSSKGEGCIDSTSMRLPQPAVVEHLLPLEPSAS